MKKLLAFLIISSVLLLAGCGTFSQKEAELGFFDEGLLAEVKLTDMPVPDDDDIRHDEDTVYCNMTEEKRIEFANKLASYLIAKDDIYYKGYHYETGCVGGIFFLPEYRFAPLTADADYGGWFAFSLTESLNNGDEYNYSYWNGVTVSVSMKEGRIGSYSYNTVIKINKDPNGIAFYPTEHEHTITYVSAGESGHFENYTCGCPHDHGAVPHYDENGDYICDACGYECDHQWDGGVEVENGWGGYVMEYTCQLCGSKKRETITIIPPSGVSHSISYQSDRTKELLMEGFAPTEAKPGDSVVLRTNPIMDADLTFYANGVRLTQTHADSDFWEYIFIMPDEDVVITHEITDGFLPD